MALKINRKVQYILKGIGIVLLLILIGAMIKILVWENNYYNTKSSEERAQADVAITSMEAVDNPAIVPLTEEDINSYQVEADTPRILEIERLKIRTTIERSVVETAGILPNPNSIYTAAWYSGSGKPGQGNYIILTGIHSYNNTDGLFANLDSLEAGDKIIIETGGGDRYTYEVKELTLVSSENAEQQLPYMQRRIDDTETLSLITTKTSDSEDSDTFVMLRSVFTEKSEK